MELLLLRCGAMMAVWLAMHFPTGILRAQTASPSTSEEPRKLRVAIETDTAPFAFLDHGRPDGFCVELLNYIARDQGYRVEYIGETWSKAVEDFRAGRIDVLANVVYLPERAQYIDFSTPHTDLKGALFVRRGLNDPLRLEDLRQLRIAVAPESFPAKFLRRSGYDDHLVFASNLEQCFNLVNQGQADAALALGLVAEKTIRDHHFQNVVPSDLELPGFEYELHFGVTKGDSDLLYRINQGIHHARETGRFDDMADRWLGPIQPRHIRWRDVAPYWIPLLIVALVLALAVYRQRRLMAQLQEQTAALRTSEERLRLALVGSREAVWDWNVVQNQVIRSDRWAEILGRSPGEILDNIDALNPWIHPEDADKVAAFKRETLNGESRVEYRLRARDGTWRWIFDRGAVVARNPNGEPARVTGIATDISDRKQIEQALARSQTLLEESQETAQIGGWEYNLSTEELYWTAQAYRIHEVDTPPARLTLDWALQFFTPAAQITIRSALDRATREGVPFDLDVEIVTGKSRLAWVRVSGRVEQQSGQVVRLHGSYQDISRQKRADEERQKLQLKMLEAQKLESLGVLAGGIAHDFNNLLTVIMGNTSLARDEPSSVPEALEQIELASQRAADLCRQMLAYAGKGRFTIEIQDLNVVVTDTVQLLKLSINKNAAIEFTLDRDALPLEADASQIRQVVMNLVINASEALGGANGRIQLSTTRETLTRERLREARLGQDVAPGDYVGVIVRDDGCGMSSDTMSRIFDPFFTTKFTGRGLGLAAVVGVVRAHRGALYLQSTLGQGTTFTIYFPRAQSGVAAIRPSSRSNPPHSASGLILVVDDEPNVRRVAGALLERHGYSVAMAADGYEALALSLAHGGKFAAVLLDLTMPGLDGPATLKELRSVTPNLPILLMSGFTEADARKRLPSDPLVSFLPKPFSSDRLLEALSQLITRANNTKATASGDPV